eukprot:TRINITY_DN1003_c0_g1_i1.p1 TRINITY_DN1003_c0_g1~~TRINITY_DN1003_c0_g1_i1.p1  ORF type:complete len:334 (+),score=74.80 TRINITY_DN1003_c0_g1_i1:82-1002(+)
METLFYFVGLSVVLHQLFTFAFWIYLNFVRTNDLSKYKKGKKEPWALVTGATDGIGKAYAEELALRGFNIVLLSRSQQKLDDVRKEIENQFNVKVQTLAVDAGRATNETYEEIKQKVASLELSVLVNNVGVSHLPEYLENVAVEEIESIVNINVLFSTRITQVLLPQLKANRSSVIINLSSLSGRAPTPFLTTYAASKAFNRSFSTGLALECGQLGVDVQSVDPGFVISNMSRMKKTSFTVCTARRCADDSLRKLPYQDVTPFWAHGLMVWSLTHLPKPVYDWYIVKMFIDLRKKAEARGLYKKEK